MVKGVPLQLQTRTYHVRSDGVTRDVLVTVADPTVMMCELLEGSLKAFSIDPERVIPTESRFVGPGGFKITDFAPEKGNTAAAAPHRLRLIHDLHDGANIVFFPSLRPPLPSATAEAETVMVDGDLSVVLRCCSAIATSAPIRQPRFAYTFFMEEEGPDAPAFPVCGPCAHTCHGMQHIHIMDPIKVLNRPFTCACATIRTLGHECYWADEPCRGALDPKLASAAVTAWGRERLAFVNHLRPQIEAEAAEKQASELEKLTQKLKSQMELTEQFHDDDAQAAARAVVPLSVLNARAEVAVDAAHQSSASDPSDEPFTIHDALLVEVASWFCNGFFSWMTRPACENCGGDTVAADDADRRAVVPTQEERINGAATVELYRCPTCDIRARFPRYTKAKRLLTYRQGRCGEFALCFGLIATSLGFECRLVSSLADQSWVEVYSTAKRRWLHVDPSYGTVDDPLTYERKALATPASKRKTHHYVFACSKHEAVDVTRRYSSAPHQLLKRDVVTETALARLLHGLTRSGLQRLGGDKPRQTFYDCRAAEEAKELSLALRSGDRFPRAEMRDEVDGDVNEISLRPRANGAMESDCTYEGPAVVRASDGSINFNAASSCNVVVSLTNAYGLGARLPVPFPATSAISDLAATEITLTVAIASSDTNTADAAWASVSLGQALSIRIDLAQSKVEVRSAAPQVTSTCTKVGGSALILDCRDAVGLAAVTACATPPRPHASAALTLLLDCQGAISVTAVFSGGPSKSAVKLQSGTKVPVHAWASSGRPPLLVAGSMNVVVKDLHCAWQ